MTDPDFLFTSESVSEGHPDKVCDRVSDEVVDLYFREALKAGYDPSRVRVACETAATTNQVALLGEMRGPLGLYPARRFNKVISVKRTEPWVWLEFTPPADSSVSG